MGKNQKKKGRGRSTMSSQSGSRGFSSQGSPMVRVPFRVSLSVTSVTTSAILYVSALSLTRTNLGDRVAAIGDAFTQFRIESLQAHASLTVDVGSAVNSATHYIGCTSTNPADFAAPTTAGQFLDLPFFDFGNAFRRLNFRMGPRDLWGMTPSKWYNTDSGATDNSAGEFFVAVQNTTAAVTVPSNSFAIVAGVVCFRGPVDTTGISLRRGQEFLSVPPHLVEGKEHRLSRVTEEKSAVSVSPPVVKGGTQLPSVWFGGR